MALSESNESLLYNKSRDDRNLNLAVWRAHWLFANAEFSPLAFTANGAIRFLISNERQPPTESSAAGAGHTEAPRPANAVAAS
jgi:hypothetical protein